MSPPAQARYSVAPHEIAPFLQIEDLAATEAYRNRIPLTVAGLELDGVRTWLAVPLREGDSIIGIINVIRQEMRPFSEKEIAIVQGFAQKAQIAMKNARLFNETREARERQTGGCVRGWVRGCRWGSGWWRGRSGGGGWGEGVGRNPARDFEFADRRAACVRRHRAQRRRALRGNQRQVFRYPTASSISWSITTPGEGLAGDASTFPARPRSGDRFGTGDSTPRRHPYPRHRRRP